MTRLYDLRRWRRRSKQFLQENPLCRMCQEIGRTTLATVVDHIKPHGGDPELFWGEVNWQGLCKPCHDGAKAALDRTGRLRGCDALGRPLDPNHPWNREG